MNTPNIPAAIDSSSVWGRVPFNAVQTTNAFSTDPTDRPFQDQGFDGMDDAGEAAKFSTYLNQLAVLFGTGSAVYQKAAADPSADDYLNYRAPQYDSTQTQIVGRYKNINNPQGNSPIAPPGATYVDASTLYPDQEDLDHDNTMNELEEYFEYKVNLNAGFHQHCWAEFYYRFTVFYGNQWCRLKSGISSGFPSQPIRRKWEIFRISNRYVLSECI